MDQETKKEFDTLGRIVKAGFDAVDARFDGVDKRFDKVESRLDGVEREVNDLKSDARDLRATVTNQYVSKTYLDQKLGDQTEEIVGRVERMIGKRFEQEKKFKAWVLEIFERNKLASSEEIQALEQLI